MEFKIEKNVPIPNGVAAKAKYPFADMDLGDSIHVPKERFGKARAAATAFGKYHQKKFAGRRDGKGGRIWRVE